VVKVPVMYDEKETRRLCARAIKQYMTTEISEQEKAEGEKVSRLLRDGKEPDQRSNATLCRALASYLKCLKSIEDLVISDPHFVGIDGSNPVLAALGKEISFTVETKGLICHDDIPKRRNIRVDW
jgi:hypothetical protein